MEEGREDRDRNDGVIPGCSEFGPQTSCRRRIVNPLAMIQAPPERLKLTMNYSTLFEVDFDGWLDGGLSILYIYDNLEILEQGSPSLASK